MRRLILALSCAAMMAATTAVPASAQVENLETAALGAVAGTAAGGYVTVSLIVLRARTGDYVHELSDVLGWGSVPVLVGAGTGATLGYLAPERLIRGTLIGAAGTALGLGTGLAFGMRTGGDPEHRWASAAIGAGAGLVVGALTGIFWPVDDADRVGTPVAAGVPIGITLRF